MASGLTPDQCAKGSVLEATSRVASPVSQQVQSSDDGCFNPDDTEDLVELKGKRHVYHDGNPYISYQGAKRQTSDTDAPREPSVETHFTNVASESRCHSCNQVIPLDNTQDAGPALEPTSPTRNPVVVRSSAEDTANPGYACIGLRYVTIAIGVNSLDNMQYVCLDTGCTMSIADSAFIKKNAPGITVHKMPTAMRVFGIGNQKHDADYFVKLPMYFHGEDGRIALVEREIHLVKELKANILIGIDILKPEHVMLDFHSNLAIFTKCDGIRACIATEAWATDSWAMNPEPVSPYPDKPVSPYPGGPAPTYPGEPAPTYPGGPAPTYPGEPAPTYPGEPAPTYPDEPAPTYPDEPAPTYPGGPAPTYPD